GCRTLTLACASVQECPPDPNRAARLWRLSARRVLDAAERPVGGEPFTHGAPERGVQLPVARAYPGERTGVVVAVGQRIDVDAPEYVAARRIEDGVREPSPVAEVVCMALQVCPVL